MLLVGGCVFCRSDCCCWVESVFIVGFHVFGKIVVCGRLECSWWIYMLLLAKVLVDIGKNLLLLERMCIGVGKSVCLGRNLCYCWQDCME